jgi:hypothetical protein
MNIRWAFSCIMLIMISCNQNNPKKKNFDNHTSLDSVSVLSGKVYLTSEGEIYLHAFQSINDSMKRKVLMVPFYEEAKDFVYREYDSNMLLATWIDKPFASFYGVMIRDFNQEKPPVFMFLSVFFVDSLKLIQEIPIELRERIEKSVKKTIEYRRNEHQKF